MLDQNESIMDTGWRGRAKLCTESGNIEFDALIVRFSMRPSHPHLMVEVHDPHLWGHFLTSKKIHLHIFDRWEAVDLNRSRMMASGRHTDSGMKTRIYVELGDLSVVRQNSRSSEISIFLIDCELGLASKRSEHGWSGLRQLDPSSIDIPDFRCKLRVFAESRPEDSVGHQVTHRVEVSPVDPGVGGQDIVELTRLAHAMFRFVTLSDVGVCCSRGFSSEGELNSVYWPVCRVKQHMSTSFLDRGSGGCVNRCTFDEFSIMCQKFAGWWKTNCDVFDLIFPWVMASSDDMSDVRTHIVHGQIALETLAWHVLVDRKGMLTKDGFNRLSAADCIQMLACMYELDTAILRDGVILKRAKEFNWATCPMRLLKRETQLYIPIVSGEDR